MMLSFILDFRKKSLAIKYLLLPTPGKWYCFGNKASEKKISRIDKLNK
jgi:hypothetical protein